MSIPPETLTRKGQPSPSTCAALHVYQAFFVRNNTSFALQDRASRAEQRTCYCLSHVAALMG